MKLINIIKNISIKFVWYDIWFGVFVDHNAKIIYVCLIPTILITIKLKDKIQQIVYASKKLTINIDVEIVDKLDFSDCPACIYYPNEGNVIQLIKGENTLEVSTSIHHEIGHLLDYYLSNEKMSKKVEIREANAINIGESLRWRESNSELNKDLLITEDILLQLGCTEDTRDIKSWEDTINKSKYYFIDEKYHVKVMLNKFYLIERKYEGNVQSYIIREIVRLDRFLELYYQLTDKELKLKQ